MIVANMAQSPDGRWRALDGDLLLRTHRLAAGSLYQAQLRYELTTRLGVEWQPAVKGMAEIRGVPDCSPSWLAAEALPKGFAFTRHTLLVDR